MGFCIAYVLLEERRDGISRAFFKCNVAFQTVVALADFDNETNEDGKIVLRESHIQQIVHMSQEFKDYLRELHQGDEGKRAERQRMRYMNLMPKMDKCRRKGWPFTVRLMLDQYDVWEQIGMPYFVLNC